MADHPRQFLCPTCPDRKVVYGYTNWRMHVQLHHGGQDPRLSKAVNDGVAAVDKSQADPIPEFYCTWHGCETMFTDVDKFYSHTHVTHKVPYPHASEVPMGAGVLQDDLADAFDNYLYLSDSYREYCKERGIEP